MLVQPDLSKLARKPLSLPRRNSTPFEMAGAVNSVKTARNRLESKKRGVSHLIQMQCGVSQNPIFSTVDTKQGTN